MRNQAIRAVSTNPDGMARATLEHCFQNQLSEEDVIALAPVILGAVEEAIKTIEAAKDHPPLCSITSASKR